MAKADRPWTSDGSNSPRFVNKTSKRRAKNKTAKQSRAKNRSKK